jgi:NAD(P)-dependent dehydrogenase (short-subunit alcohol dehydrogenase family)
MMPANHPFSVFNEFKGKRVLVTGGTKDIGEAIVQRFRLRGALVAIAASSPSPQTEASVLFIKADVETAAGVQKVVDQIQWEWGGLDILVNNVCDTNAPAGGFEAPSDEVQRSVLNANLLATVRLDRAFLPGMIERKSGVIIHISSISHRLPFANAMLPYSAAKCALVTYSKGLAKEAAPNGVRVNVISPGCMETSAVHGMIVNMIGGIPTGRLDRPDRLRQRCRSWS